MRIFPAEEGPPAASSKKRAARLCDHPCSTPAGESGHTPNELRRAMQASKVTPIAASSTWNNPTPTGVLPLARSDTEVMTKHKKRGTSRTE